ncbi:MAG: hypothetical protein PWQ30_2080, partial [Euryarchaeota archaeon]|nr:hypothetical protein [Euryarchaeota archaeon]
PLPCNPSPKWRYPSKSVSRQQQGLKNAEIFGWGLVVALHSKRHYDNRTLTYGCP